MVNHTIIKTIGGENKFGKKLNDIELQSITSGTDATCTSCESITSEDECVTVSACQWNGKHDGCQKKPGTRYAQSLYLMN